MDKNWDVKDVMDYFGDYFEDEDCALGFMDTVEMRLELEKKRLRKQRSFKWNYRELMAEMRKLLKEFGYDVPFALQYRRAK